MLSWTQFTVVFLFVILCYSLLYILYCYYQSVLVAIFYKLQPPSCYYFPATARKLGLTWVVCFQQNEWLQGWLSPEWAIFIPLSAICILVEICHIILWLEIWFDMKICLVIHWDVVIDQICMVKTCLVIRLDDVIDKTRATTNYPNTPNCASFCLRAVTSQRECDISNWTARDYQIKL